MKLSPRKRSRHVRREKSSPSGRNSLCRSQDGKGCDAQRTDGLRRKAKEAGPAPEVWVKSVGFMGSVVVRNHWRV